MISKLTLRSLSCALAGTALLTGTTLEAAPVSLSPATHPGLSTSDNAASVEQVAYRRRARRVYGGGYRRGYDPTGAAVAGAALGLIGAGIAGATAPRYEYYPSYGYPAYGPGYGYGPRPYGYYGY